MNRKKSDEKHVLPVIGFLIFAVIIVIVCFFINKKMDNIDAGGNSVAEVTEAVSRTEPAETAAETPAETEIPEKTEISEETVPVTAAETTSAVTTAVDPSRIVWEDDVSEIGFTDVLLDKGIEENKTFKTELSRLISEGDRIDAFRFTVRAEDGVSPLGEVKGGFGISVDNSCEARTDDIWYQTPEDFSVYTEESSVEIEWKIPDEIKDYITVSDGRVLFGYWWSNSERVYLDRIVCVHRNMKILPDETDPST